MRSPFDAVIANPPFTHCATSGCDGRAVVVLRSYFKVPGGRSVAFYGQCLACRLEAVAKVVPDA